MWLISPDRPGIGASEPAPDRTLLDWPDDVAALAALLGIDTFSVMGWSMGGQYAAECAFARAQAEALRTSAGMVTDYALWARPWGFEPEAITVEVDVWHGERDSLVRPEWGDELARRIPNATRLTVADAGHFLAHDHYDEILTRLVP